ncbi:MAG: 50S ribosome-binding GTPase, partial [Lachnospiraceae bacterium]|nr:50S ribosome-binding GTPase [Lachnospiraceae bacterium]
MSIKIALAGNPNCGKTTLFNELTGSNQYVGNWPGVTVEKKEGKLKKELYSSNEDIIIEDLPGIYSLSPYTTEEIVTRDYLVNNKPDCILNIIDGTNIERNLYLTTQLKEIGIPMVIAINMLDVVEKNGDKIDLDTLSRSLHCPVLGISALKNIGISEVIDATIKEAALGKADEDSIPHVYTGSVEHSIAHIEETIQDKVPEKYIRWYAIKRFVRDKKAYSTLNLSKDDESHLENHIRECEEELSDKSVCIITKDRYNFISRLLDRSIIKATRKDILTTTDTIDRFLT